MAAKDDVKAKAAAAADKLRRQAAALDKASGRDGERAKDAQRKRTQRAAARDLSIPRVADPVRRRDCLADVYQFLPTYAGNIFYQRFTSSRRQMIEAIIHAATQGGDIAIAAPRGDGKTRSALFVTLWLMLTGKLQFAVVISKSGPRASRELKNLCEALLEAKLFALDFPELLTPLLEIGGWASRARQQTVYGEPTRIELLDQSIILPTVTTELLRANGWHDDIESVAQGQIIASVGIDGPIRGLTIRNRRPDLALLDDVDDRESARSELQTDGRAQIIEADVAGLGGPDRVISRCMLCTCINASCIASTYTDPARKSSWRGQRHKLLVTPPDRLDWWDEYVQLRQSRSVDDPDARVAFEFYAARQAAMDAGAVVGNPQRFDARLLDDGQPAQLSALQACYDLLSDIGQEAFDAEFQNCPAVETGPVESGITPTRIQRQLSGYPRKAIPPGCTKLTCGIDVGKNALHWAVLAWQPDATAYVVDYHVAEVHGVQYGSDTGLDLAITRAVLSLLESLRDQYADSRGEIMPIHRTLVDAGYRTQAIYASCQTAGLGVQPIMGFGRSSGCTEASFSDNVQRRSIDRQPGDGWFLSRKGKLWLVAADADRWKGFLHDRLMTATGKPGCLTLFGLPSQQPAGRLSDDEKRHHAFARHLTSEIEIEEPHRGGMRRRWKTKSDLNHWLDATYYACVGASIEGIRLGGSSMPQPSGPPLRLSEIQQGKQQQRTTSPAAAQQAAGPLKLSALQAARR